jgi:molecular chaperone GrpE
MEEKKGFTKDENIETNGVRNEKDNANELKTSDGNINTSIENKVEEDKVSKIKEMILSMKREIEEKEKKIKEYEELLKRIAADFDNYKKRVSKEKIEYTRFANKDLILDLLPIIDNFDKAIEVIEKSELLENVKDLFVGIKLVHKELINLLFKYGVVKVDLEGEIFDPNLSEAIEIEEVEIEPHEEEKEIIVKEYLKPYKMYDKVIRAGKVKVQKRKKKKNNNQENNVENMKDYKPGDQDMGTSS